MQCLKPPRLEMTSISITEQYGPTERKVIFARPTFENLLPNKNSSLILHQPSKLFMLHLIRFARMRNYLQFGLKSCLKPSIHSYDQRDPYCHANSVLISRGNAKSFFFSSPLGSLATVPSVISIITQLGRIVKLITQ